MTDEIEVTEPVADEATTVASVADPAPAAAHESLIQRIEDAIEKYGSPAHALDWIKQEIAKFRAG